MVLFDIYFGIIIFILGLLLGSFFNVCIYRIPNDLSVVKPPSYCPKCNTRLKTKDLIPVVSFLVLKGKCRYCKEKISGRYALVEALTAALFLLAYIVAGINYDLFILLAFIGLLIPLSFIDIDHRIIPDRFLISGLLLAGIFIFSPLIIKENYNISYFNYIDEISTLSNLPLGKALFGGLVGGGFLFLVDITGRLLLKKEAMGMGDIKLMTWIGLILGVRGVIVALLFAIWIGAIIGVYMLKKNSEDKKRDSYMPFGPFLALGSIISILWGENIINWYLSLM